MEHKNIFDSCFPRENYLFPEEIRKKSGFRNKTQRPEYDNVHTERS